MRSSWVAGGLILGLTLLAGGAIAHGSVDAHAPTTANGEDLTDGSSFPACVPTCEVDSRRQGFVPALLLVEENTPVVWTSTDGDGHTVTENPPSDAPTMVAEASSNFYADACFDVYFQPGSPAEVTFDARADGLWALETSVSGAEWKLCDTAYPTPDGGWLVTYHCQIHPQLQQAGILVRPS